MRVKGEQDVRAEVPKWMRDELAVRSKRGEEEAKIKRRERDASVSV